MKGRITTTTFRLTTKQHLLLNRIVQSVRLKTGKHLDKSAVVRAFISALELLDFSACTTEMEVRRTVRQAVTAASVRQEPRINGNIKPEKATAVGGRTHAS